MRDDGDREPVATPMNKNERGIEMDLGPVIHAYGDALRLPCAVVGLVMSGHSTR